MICSLADALDLEMPELPEEEGVTRVSIVSAGAAHAFSETKVCLIFFCGFLRRKR